MPTAAVLGSPVAHSLSPILHEAGYAACGLRGWRYLRQEVRAGELAGFVHDLDAGWLGLSLTMPLKEAAFEVAASVSEIAHRAGAINTLIRRSDGGWDATNTDVAGVAGAVGGVEHHSRALVLGSGATARSAVLALVGVGVGEIVVAARNPHSADAVVDLARGCGAWAQVAPLDQWPDHLAPLVISTLPPAASRHLADVLVGCPGSGGPVDPFTLLDVVYADWPTPLARAVRARGSRVISGLDMLVHQAAAQFELFTGQPAPVAAMFAAGRAALGRP